jgi:hypothetical protein
VEFHGRRPPHIWPVRLSSFPNSASCLHYLERERAGNRLTNFEVFLGARRSVQAEARSRRCEWAKCFTSNVVRGTFTLNL